jgi:hypothetical protein
VSVESVLSRLDRVKQTAPGRWVARCPAHDDNGPSLSIRATPDDTVLIHCFAGCETSDVLAEIGLTFSDLYPPRPASPATRHRKPPTDYRGLWLLCRRAFYVVWVATERLEAGLKLSPDDLALVQASRRRIERVMEVLGHG